MAELDPLRWKALAVVCAAFFMTVLDVSIVNVALPSIGRALHFSRDNLQWVITAYAITFGGFLLLGGRAADLFGRRRVFLDRRRRLHDRVVPLRPRLVGRRADRRARGAGPRRRDHLARRALDHHDDVRGRPRAQQGTRHLGCDRRLGRRGRRARRRRADEVPRLGVDLLRQRAGRLARLPARAALRAREPLRARDARPTSPAPSRSRPGSRCSSTPSRRRPTTAGARAWTFSRIAASLVLLASSS